MKVQINIVNGNRAFEQVLKDFGKFLEDLKNHEDIEIIYNKISALSKQNFFFNLENEIFKFNNLSNDYFERVLQQSQFLLEYGYDKLNIGYSILPPFEKKRWDAFLQDLDMKKAVYIYESDLFLIGDKTKGKEYKTVFP